MDIKKLTKSLLDVSTPKMLRDWVQALMNRVDELTQKNNNQEKEIARLESQIRKLQGLPSKPKFSSSDKTSDLDCEDEDDDDDSPEGKTSKKRKKAAQKNRRKKKDLIVDTKKKIAVNPDELDATFEYKGSRKVVVQDIEFKRNNIEFELERFYSEERRKTVEADLPGGYDRGYFGPNVIAFIKCSYYEGDVTIKKIFKILEAIGIKISIRQINRIINDCPDELVTEMEEARSAGIEKAGFQQIDDTAIKVLKSHSQSAFTTVTCNPYFTNLFTSTSKSRFNAVLALAGGNKEPLYKMNLQAILMVFSNYKSLKIQLLMEKYQSGKLYTELELATLFCGEDFKNLKPPIIRDIKTAMLIGAFYDGHLGVTGDALVSDDAPQFNNIYDDHVLCWYHEMRHYKELCPSIKEHELQLQLFFTEVKSVYKMLKSWVETRSDKVREYVLRWFSEYFKTSTGYRLLDSRKALTFSKMHKLLAPLFTRDTLKLPLDNNESERDIRGRKVKQKISLFDQTWEGAKARDLHISLKQTCRKNGVSFYQFLLDRIQNGGIIPQLSETIQAR